MDDRIAAVNVYGTRTGEGGGRDSEGGELYSQLSPMGLSAQSSSVIDE